MDISNKGTIRAIMSIIKQWVTTNYMKKFSLKVNGEVVEPAEDGTLDIPVEANTTKYDNTMSELAAENTQDAIDELLARIKALEGNN